MECNWKEIKRTLINSHVKLRKLFEIKDTLSKLSILTQLSEKELFEFSGNLKKEKFKKGEIIIKEGTFNSKFYFIIKGKVKLKEEKHQSTIHVYDKGNCFGQFSILNNKPNNFSIIASETVICYTITKELFLELLNNQRINDYMKEKMFLENFDIQFQDLFYLSHLGKGKFGNVYLVHNTTSLYAVKVMNKFTVEQIKGGVQCLINEKKTLISLDHPFVVKLVKTMKTDGFIYILQEYIKGENFGDYLDKRKSYNNLYETKFYGACMFEMINYLNKNKVVHRDIKPGNLMLDSKGYLKLIDFGTARKLQNITHTLMGTPNFVAPEILLGNGYSFSCDYWSIGVTMFFIYFGYLPFGTKAEFLNDIYKDIIQNEPEFPYDTPFELKVILKGLLNKNPMERISSFENIKEESFFSDFPWDDLITFQIKPPYLPIENEKDSKYNLQNCNYPFEILIENQKSEISQIKSIKVNREREGQRNENWFHDF